MGTRGAVIGGVLLAAAAGCGEADVRAKAEPAATLQVTCTRDGIEVGQTLVRTSPDGVHVRITDRSGFRHPSLIYGIDGDIVGGDPVAAPTARVLTVQPGRWLVNCSEGTSGSLTGSPEVTVVDPNGHWRSPAPGPTG